jgi:hypothetical protein
MKKLALIFITSNFLSIQCLAQTTVVTDPGAYSYFNGLDKKSQEQIEFLQKIQDTELALKSSLEGNKRIGYGVNNSLSFYDDFFILKESDQKQNIQLGDKPSAISKNLNLLFPIEKFKIPNDSNKSKNEIVFKKKAFQQQSIKSALIFAEMISNNTKYQLSQVSALAGDIDGTNTLKEALDVNNRLVLELLLEIRNTNLILANLVRLNAAEKFEGLTLPDYTEEEEDGKALMEGKGNLGGAITRGSGRGGKFSSMTR